MHVPVRILYILFTFGLLNNLFAQENNINSYEAIREILLTKDHVHQIIIQNLGHGNGAIFWPNDLKEISNSSQRIDHWIKTKDGLFTNPDGTGRLYQAFLERDTIHFKRIDQTIFSGNNFLSFVFSANDTIFSLGGYGIWRRNGLLRYYDSLKRGWEVKKLNIEIPIDHQTSFITRNLTVHADSAIYLLMSPENTNDNQQYLKTNRLPAGETVSLINKLNIVKGDWTSLGTIKQKSRNLLKSSVSIISMPFGQLVINSSDSIQGSHYYLLSFSKNKIFKISKDKESIIWSWFMNETLVTQPVYQVIYSKDSTLVFIREDLKRLELNFTKSDFIDTGMKIYEPVSSVSEASVNLWHYAPLALGFILSGAALVVIFKQRRSRNGIIGQQIVSKFTAQELELMQFLSEQPEHTATTEELNTLLGTTKKSTDVQKKVRSEITRSINERYHELTLDEEKLIHQVRLESDKRMVKYEIDYKKYQHLQSLLPAKK